MDVIALDVARDDQVLGPVDDEVDQDVGAGAGMQDVEQVLGVHGQRGRVHPVPVQHPRHAASGPQLAGDALAGAFLGSATSLTSAMFGSFEGVGVSAGHGTNAAAMRPRGSRV